MTRHSSPGPGPWTVRGIDRDEMLQVSEVTLAAMILPDLPEEVEERARHFPERHGYGRILAATDDQGRIIGSTRSHALDMCLPGGVRRVAGVTGVGVWPTHRRQGVLSAMKRRQLADMHAAGEHYAALWASESGIYGRYGYGLAATEIEDATIEVAHAGLRPDAPRDSGLRAELMRPAQARAELEEVFARVAGTQVGRYARDDAWWERILEAPSGSKGRGPLRVSVVRGADGAQAYALHRAENRWSVSGPNGTLHVGESVATTPAAHTALYEHLFSFDLVARVRFSFMSLDDPLQALLADHQRLQAPVADSLWMRLVDVPSALAERTYAAPVEAVVEVADDYAPWNAGRWRLRAGPEGAEGAEVRATDAEPDLSTDVSHLGAAYLGQRPLLWPLRAGLVTEHTPGVVAGLDRALYRPDAAFCGLVF